MNGVGRHRKQSRGRNFRIAATAGVGASGILLPVTGGVAHADTPTGPPGGWSSIVFCESGGNFKIGNKISSASGAWQFIDSTWRSNGGGQFAKRAKFASPQQQATVAARLFRARGLQPWDASKHCWGSKVAAAKRRGDPAPMTDDLQEMLHPGAKPAPKHAAKPAPKHAKPNSAGAEHHKVRSGDTLSQIAVDHGMTWQQLFDMNRAELSNPNQIFPGMSLELP